MQLHYPSVDIYPQTFPSANRDTISPICRTHDESLILLKCSDMHQSESITIHDASQTSRQTVDKKVKPPSWLPWLHRNDHAHDASVRVPCSVYGCDQLLPCYSHNADGLWIMCQSGENTPKNPRNNLYIISCNITNRPLQLHHSRPQEISPQLRLDATTPIQLTLDYSSCLRQTAPNGQRRTRWAVGNSPGPL